MLCLLGNYHWLATLAVYASELGAASGSINFLKLHSHLTHSYSPVTTLNKWKKYY
jgi:hypothetical protein